MGGLVLWRPRRDTHAASHGAGSLLGRGMRRTHLGKQNLLALLQLLRELAERGADLSLRKRNEKWATGTVKRPTGTQSF